MEGQAMKNAATMKTAFFLPRLDDVCLVGENCFLYSLPNCLNCRRVYFLEEDLINFEMVQFDSDVAQMKRVVLYR